MSNLDVANAVAELRAWANDDIVPSDLQALLKDVANLLEQTELGMVEDVEHRAEQVRLTEEFDRRND